MLVLTQLCRKLAKDKEGGFSLWMDNIPGSHNTTVLISQPVTADVDSSQTFSFTSVLALPFAWCAF